MVSETREEAFARFSVALDEQSKLVAGRGQAGPQARLHAAAEGAAARDAWIGWMERGGHPVIAGTSRGRGAAAGEASLGPATGRGQRSVPDAAHDDSLDELRRRTRYNREKRDIYRAKMYGSRPTSPARLRQLEQAYQLSETRLQRAEGGLVSGGD